MTDRESIFEDNLERSYWDFILNTTTLKGYSQRDCFKMACRKNLKPKPEKQMADKIQMTEEQAKQMYLECGDMGNGWKLFVERMKESGYIIKSELQQKVGEAERMYDYWYSDKETNCEVVMDAMKIAIQLLKQSHPEFKK